MEVQVGGALHIVAAAAAHIRHDRAAAAGFISRKWRPLVFGKTATSVPAVIAADLVAEFLTGHVDESDAVVAASGGATEPLAVSADGAEATHTTAAARKHVADVVSVGCDAGRHDSLLVLGGQGTGVGPEKRVGVGIQEDGQQRSLHHLEAHGKVALVGYVDLIHIFRQSR